ncbi:hypothetical protein HMN09_01075300 [Mycena chlorophos]|uniref:Uncharacterized protein n=1 Tax=Mycena chlorophos TaxID=658473 RepID=A0A8H6SF28_MYCCL|nr:hypothetical protein HMN09_01075300 [Mycena chlorophos]
MFKAILFAALAPVVLGATFVVQLGLNNGLTFTPNTLVADIGDVITFIEFVLLPSRLLNSALPRSSVSRNHTSTTTNFDGAVCPPPDGGVGPNGWDSGFLSDLDGSLPSFNYTVVDTLPHFASCKQAAGAHCVAGMVFALNPTAEQTFEQFQTNAETNPIVTK